MPLWALVIAFFSTPVQAQDEWPAAAIASARDEIGLVTRLGPRRGDEALENPEFLPLDLAGFVGGLEPVIAVAALGVVKAYPLRIVIAHGVVNDQLDGMKVALSYCGSCNAALVLHRESGGRSLRLADSGLAASDHVRLLYDLETESWWRENDGVAVAGALKGERLGVLPARLMSMAQLRRLHASSSQVLVLSDTDRSRLGTKGRMELPAMVSDDALDAEDDGRGEVPILDEKSWSVGILHQEDRLGRESPIIVAPRQPKQQGPRQ